MIRSTAILLAALFWAAAVRAGQPLISETADVIGNGDCQLETSLARGREKDAPSQTLAEAAASCGLGGHSEFGLTWAGARADGATDRLMGFKGKTMLVEPKDGVTGIALAYSIWRSNDGGEGWNQTGGRVFGVVSRELGKDLTGHLNLGWLRSGRQQLNHTTWSLGLEGEELGPLGWAADVFGDDRSRPWLSGGFKLPLGEKVSASLAYAQQFESPRVQLLTLGLKIEFF